MNKDKRTVKNGETRPTEKNRTSAITRERHFGLAGGARGPSRPGASLPPLVTVFFVSRGYDLDRVRYLDGTVIRTRDHGRAHERECLSKKYRKITIVVATTSKRGVHDQARIEA